MWKWLRWVLLAIGIIVVAFVILLIQPWVLFPHGNAEISLPFAPEDDQYTDMIPMGEIEEHHNATTGLPEGHPGIDFQWNKGTEILAVGDGLILNVSKDSEGKYTIQQYLGAYYKTVYQELNSIEPNIRRLTRVKKGQKLGVGGYYRENFNGAPKSSDPSIQMHWDFSSSSMLTFRLCPQNHFDAESKKRIEAIWERTKAKVHNLDRRRDLSALSFRIDLSPSISLG